MVVEEITVVQVLPLLVEYSIFTLLMVPVEVQKIVCVEPAAQVSPPLGETTVMEEELTSCLKLRTVLRVLFNALRLSAARGSV